LGSDGFDSRSDGDASPLLIQRTVTMLRFHLVRTLATKREVRHTFARVQRWCLRAMRGHACRQNSVRFVWGSKCVHPPTAALPGPTHSPCTLQKSSKVGRKGPRPHGGAPAGQLQLVRSRSLRAGSAAVLRMSHQSPLLRDAPHWSSPRVSKRHAAHAARRVRPPRAARKARKSRQIVGAMLLRPPALTGRANRRFQDTKIRDL